MNREPYGWTILFGDLLGGLLDVIFLEREGFSERVQCIQATNLRVRLNGCIYWSLSETKEVKEVWSNGVDTDWSLSFVNSNKGDRGRLRIRIGGLYCQ